MATQGSDRSGFSGFAPGQKRQFASSRYSVFRRQFASSRYSAYVSSMTDAVENMRQEALKAQGAALVLNKQTTFMLLLVPFMYASRSITLGFAISTGPPFSPLVPLLMSQVALAGTAISLLFLKHGAEHVWKLFSLCYVRMVVMGILAATASCLQNLALTRISPTFLTVLMSTQSVTTGIAQVCLLGKRLSKTEWLSLSAGLLLVSQNVFIKSDDVGTIDVLGLACGLGAATSSAMAGLGFQYFAVRFTMGCDTEDRKAEVIRLIAMNEAWKIPTTLAIIYISDYERITTFGFFFGWDWKVALASFASFLMVGYRLFSISKFGALATTVVSSVEIGIVFVLDLFVSDQTNVGVPETLGVLTLLLVVLLFNISALEVVQARKAAWEGAIVTIEDTLASVKRSKETNRSPERDPKEISRISEEEEKEKGDSTFFI